MGTGKLGGLEEVLDNQALGQHVYHCFYYLSIKSPPSLQYKVWIIISLCSPSSEAALDWEPALAVEA